MINWDAIGAIGEIIGAAAVVATLVYLAKETRTNTRAVIASSARNSNWGFAEFNTQICDSEYMSELLYKSMRPEMQEFSEIEWFRFCLFARSEVGRVQDAYLQAKLGFQDRALADTQLNYLRGFIELPAWRRFWDDETRDDVWTRDFVTEINSREPIHLGLSNQQTIKA